MIDQFPGFKRRMQWFMENRHDLTRNVASMMVPGKGERRLLSVVSPAQLRRICTGCSTRTSFFRLLSRTKTPHYYQLKS